MLYEGTGVKQDFAMAFQYLNRAANKGDNRAQFNVGVMYFKGQGVPQSYSEALRYYCLASEQNHPEATHNVALMFEEGLCMPPNQDEAYRYYLKAAELGLDKSQYNLARLIHICGKDLEEALYWYRTAAASGHPPAMCAMGDLYLNGHGVDVDLSTALRWYRRAVANGNEDAKVDVEKVTIMLADLGNVKAQLKMGNSFAAKKQYETAIQWFRLAADQSFYPKAQYNLAVLLDRGLGCDQDKEEAARLFEAARPFYPRAQCLD
jgi:TPR repeat protein